MTLSAGNPDGDYLIELSAGSSNPAVPIRYVLMKVAAPNATSIALDWPRHPYLSGRAIVAKSEGADSRISAMNQAHGTIERQLSDRHWLMRMADAKMAGAVSPQRETLAWIEELRQQLLPAR